MPRSIKQSDDNNWLFNRILLLCEESNITISRLCGEVTGSTGNINSWKNGSFRPEHLIAISKRFNVSVDEILGLTPPSKKDLINPTHIKLIRYFDALDPIEQDAFIGDLAKAFKSKEVGSDELEIDPDVCSCDIIAETRLNGK